MNIEALANSYITFLNDGKDEVASELLEAIRSEDRAAEFFAALRNNLTK